MRIRNPAEKLNIVSGMLESLCVLFVAQVYLQPFLRSKLFHNYVRDLIATIQVSYFSIFSIISSVGDPDSEPDPDL
jgi:hypothetical protein